MSHLDRNCRTCKRAFKAKNYTSYYCCAVCYEQALNKQRANHYDKNPGAPRFSNEKDKYR